METDNGRSNMEACADRYVHYLTQTQTPKAMKLEDIWKAILEDAELQQIVENFETTKLISFQHRIKRSLRNSVLQIKTY